MKIVLDTNVLIAALISRGVCADILEHCVLSHSIVGSEFILTELRDHLLSKFKFSKLDSDEAVKLLATQMDIVTPLKLDHQVCRDSDDDQILGTALAGNADCIVTGDKDLLVLGGYEGIEIINPRGFLDFEAE